MSAFDPKRTSAAPVEKKSGASPDPPPIRATLHTELCRRPALKERVRRILCPRIPPTSGRGHRPVGPKTINALTQCSWTNRWGLVSPMRKVIWTLWFQGWDSAPNLVRACLESWKSHNADWEIRALDADNLQDFLAADSDEVLRSIDDGPLDAKSDLIRIALLRKFGGVWVDATLYCLRPLDEWLPAVMQSGFFAFERPGPDRLLSSWFLATETNHRIITHWFDACQSYWHGRTERHHYFWFHYLFEDIYKSQSIVKRLWDETPKISADLPHFMAPYAERLNSPPTLEDYRVLHGDRTPVLKLTHKVDHGSFAPGSLHDFLIKQASKRRSTASPKMPNGATPLVTSSNSKKMLVCWYGSIDGHGTIGDLLSVQSVTAKLATHGFSFVHASATSDEGVTGPNVPLNVVDPDSVSTLIFICGPIIKNHPTFEQIFDRFSPAFKVGVGVSLFRYEQPNFADPFDFSISRENQLICYEDVAMLAPSVGARRSERSSKRPLKIGVSLRGAQGEYGEKRCLHERTEELVLTAISEASRCRPTEVVSLENHLVRANKRPAEIEVDYSSCDLIITSRFHGGVLAVRNGVPFIAIDQITGGAKVSKLLGGLGWAHVYRVNDVGKSELVKSILELGEDPRSLELEALRRAGCARAELTLDTLVSVLLRHS